MKKSIILSAAMFIGTLAFGQQEFQNSQYLQNLYVLNPAASGLTDNVDINLSYRQQWSGFQGAPETYYISANGLLGKGSMGANKIFALRTSDPYISSDDKNVETDADGTVQDRKVRHALGGMLLIDKAGHFRKNMGAVSYAIHLPLTAKMNLSFGLKAGLNNIIIDPAAAGALANDASLANYATLGNNSDNVFDVNAGLMVYTDKFYAGYSTGQLFQNKIAFNDTTTDGSLAMHHYVLAAYRFEAGEKWGITPGALLRATQGSANVDVTLKADYMRKFWAGVSVRPGDAIVGLLGLRITNFINLGYSYDITTSDISTVSSGSHEFVLNFMLNK